MIRTAFAQPLDNTVPPEIVSFMGRVTDAILNPILGVIFALALVYFLFGLMRLIFNAGDEGQASDGRRHMLWGLVGMSIMVSVFGLLNLIDSFVDNREDLNLPDEVNSMMSPTVGP